MPRDDYPIPKNLRRRALARLGRFREPVEEFVQRANKIRWLEHAGRPEPWDSEVVRVGSLEEARKAYHEFLPLSETVWESLESIGKAAQRFDAMQAAEDYAIAASKWPDEESASRYDLLQAKINSDTVGSLREIVLEDLVSIRFYRQCIEWYERGHCRCAITGDGRPVIW